VMSIFVKRVLSGIPPIIYGDGQQTRDYTYIDDVINALSLMLEKKEPIMVPVNLGTGREVRIVDLASMIIELSGQRGRIQPVFVEPRPGEVNRLVADNSRAEELLGWSPKYSLEEGLTSLIDWYKNYKSEEWSKPG
jgi:UDP-glucose 4-epimerase